MSRRGTRAASGAAATFAAALCGVAGCTVGPEYARPATQLPATYRSGVDASPDPATGSSESPPVVDVLDTALRTWWDRFNDPVLSRLIEAALGSNLDLEAAAARLDRSRAILGLSRAELLPSATGRADATRLRSSGEVDQGPSGAGGRTTNRFSLGLDASWEIDFFGGRRRAVQSARAEMEFAEADLHAVRVGVAGEVADAYLARLGALERLEIARQTVESYRDTLGLTMARARSGLVSELDAALAEAELDAALATLPALRTEVTLQENRLAVLLATTPGEIESMLGSTAAVPDAPAIDERGVPVDLLRRRPDVIAAERRVASTSATIGEQIAEYFPRVSLVGEIGLSASDAGDLLTSGARTWAAGPTVRWRVLDFQRIDNAVAAARADERGAIAAYRSAVIGAVRDVEDAAARFDGTRQEMATRSTALTSRSRALDVARAQYSAGLSEFLPVLDATRGVNQARTELALARERHARSGVALFRSLGGGWDGPSGERLGVGLESPAR